MRFKKRYFFLPLLALFLGYMLFSTYDEVREKTINEFNTQQIMLAKQAAKGIKNFFNYYFRNLTHFAQIENIVHLDDTGKSLLETFYQNHSDVISAITRVGKTGRITYTIPFNKSAIGADISKQKHMQAIIRDHTPVISDVFKTVQGYSAIAYHVPVFSNGAFHGTLAILVPFNKISKEYLENIKIGKGGYAWVMSQAGIELYNSKSSHVGQSVFETYDAYPAMSRMFHRMVKGEQGITTYDYNAAASSNSQTITSHAAYYPILLGNTLWSIVVTTPEDEVLSTMKGFRNRLFLISALLMAVGLLFCYFLIKAWAVLKEETKRKKAEAALSESEERYKTLISTIPDIVLRTDLEGTIIFVNDIALQSTGYDKSEIYGKNIVQFIAPEDHDRLLKNIPLMRHQKLGPKEYHMIKKDGGKLLFEANSSILQNRNGDQYGIVNVCRDITQRKQAEMEKKSLEEKLTRSQKMEALGLLAGGVAHDLNNVLSGIVSYPELILVDLPEKSKLRRPIETIKDSGHRAAAIVQDLLTVARGVAIAKEPLNINDLVNEYLLSPECHKLKQFYPAVAIKTNLDKALLNTEGSQIHIKKVLMNLVSNASEAIEGSGTVTISTMNRYIEHSLRGYDDVIRGEYAIMAITDGGSGISSDDLERVFEPFYTKKIMGRSGTGLGLAVVWNVMQDHKGYINVTSGENGTTFDLYFPITRKEISNEDRSIPYKDYRGNNEMILVVDDVESQREISSKMLETLGYRTETVSSGEKAVEYLKTHSVDLIVLDMIMDTGINGRETYERIVKIHSGQKAIIVSGFAETDDVREAQKMGAGKYIKKPVTMESIGLAVKEELGSVRP
jgi:PAS domain S-box-containing protein